MQICGEISRSSNGIEMAVNNAHVTVRRVDEVKNIEIHSFCPEKWMVLEDSIKHANVVQQYAKFVSRGGCSMLAAQGKIQNLSITRGDHSVNVSSCHDVNVVKNDVFVNGTRTQLSDIRKDFNPVARDEVVVLVPRHYRGKFELNVLGNSRIHMSDWQAGSVRIQLAATARAVVNACRLTELTNFTIRPIGKNPRMNVKATVDSIDADLIDIHLGSHGRVRLKEIRTDLFKAKTLGAALEVQGFAKDFELEDLGTGHVRLEGEFGNLQKLLTGPQGAEIHLIDVK